MSIAMHDWLNCKSNHGESTPLQYNTNSLSLTLQSPFNGKSTGKEDTSREIKRRKQNDRSRQSLVGVGVLLLWGIYEACEDQVTKGVAHLGFA